MDIESYEQLMARLDLLKTLVEGHREVLEGRTYLAREGVARLREEFDCKLCMTLRSPKPRWKISPWPRVALMPLESRVP